MTRAIAVSLAVAASSALLPAADLAQNLIAWSPPPPPDDLVAAESRPHEETFEDLTIQLVVLGGSGRSHNGLVRTERRDVDPDVDLTLTSGDSSLADRDDVAIDGQLAIGWQLAGWEHSDWFGAQAHKLHLYARAGSDPRANDAVQLDTAVGIAANQSIIIPFGIWAEVGHSEERGTHLLVDGNACLFHALFESDELVTSRAFGMRYRWTGGPHALRPGTGPVSLDLRLDYQLSELDVAPGGEAEAFVIDGHLLWRALDHLVLGTQLVLATESLDGQDGTVHDGFVDVAVAVAVTF